MNLFLQLSKPNVDIPEDSEVLGKFENWLHRILQMSWDDLLHEAVKLGGKLVARYLSISWGAGSSERPTDS